MEEVVTRLLDAFEAVRNGTNVKACFGEPVTVEGRTVIPVAKVAYGFGIGTGPGKGGPSRGAEPDHTWDTVSAGGGGGGGTTSSPVAYIEVRDGETRVEPILDQQKLALVSMLVAAWSLFWVSRTLAAIFGSRD